MSINDPGTTQVLAYGNLVPGTGFLTLANTGGGFSPTTNLKLSFNECLAAGQGGVCTGNQSGFFVAPPAGLDLAIGNFSASKSVTTVTTNGNSLFINTQGGGGNVTVGGDFTWSPAGASTPMSGGNIVNANNFNIADFTSVSVNTTTGTFTESGALDLLGFLNGGTSVSASGLGYSLYLPFSATGTLSGIPAIAGSSSAGTYTGLTYQLVGSTFGAPSFSVSNGAVIVNDPGATQVLAYGNLVPGTGFLTLTNTGSGLSPTANFTVSVNECLAAGQGGVCTSDESGFFVSPADLDLAIVNLAASDSVTTLSVAGNSAFLNVVGGGGNVTFEGSASRVPEPGTLAALLMGLLALSTVARFRRR